MASYLTVPVSIPLYASTLHDVFKWHSSERDEVASFIRYAEAVLREPEDQFFTERVIATLVPLTEDGEPLDRDLTYVTLRDVRYPAKGVTNFVADSVDEAERMALECLQDRLEMARTRLQAK
ncbi:hypothetical protein [Micromonospora sp. C81]|uniref:hypothetical protein n=1 Tax=Micromonospora sp. C81 TaxID=2824881 RepID=UPI001B372936|nr:hypothetical protein [Micromonospora sp. C81]MBQ1039297.1 hypothetical protein [Micromonospora sp. C81]